MPTLTTEAGKQLDAATPADAERVRVVARIEDDAARAEPQGPPKRSEPTPAVIEKPRARRGRPPKSEQARTTSTAVVTLDDAQRAEGIRGYVQLGAGLCLLAHQNTKKDAYKADAIVIASRADDIADACVKAAHANPGFGAALDKVCTAGPYAALITVLVGVGTQVARNHKPSLDLPGTTDPAKILAACPEQEEQADGPAAAA